MKKELKAILITALLVGLALIFICLMQSCQPIRYGCPGQGSGLGYGGYK